jgi:hypothetical protein
LSPAPGFSELFRAKGYRINIDGPNQFLQPTRCRLPVDALEGQAKQIPDARLILNRHVKIAARDADIAVACGISDFG